MTEKAIHRIIRLTGSILGMTLSLLLIISANTRNNFTDLTLAILLGLYSVNMSIGK